VWPVVQVVGVVVLCWGVFSVSVPAGLIVLGSIVLLAGVLGEMGGWS
jgi:hypothetical protein